MWKLTKEKNLSNKIDLELWSLLKAMAHDTYATYAGEFDSQFKQILKEIKPSNKFLPELMYRVTQRNQHSVEIWKMYPNGDFKEKLGQADYVKES